ncbi:DUF4376 domain-containing protein [Vibrio plantisponsor]|uniref:DUF4376 domain-containing protein n=1 Tax=Vibrio plantisponsor TaxID=664643 RepID=A0ABU4IDY3_9VIBR|nr:DUF4376 domain-containing protein [Vibrio plantisponsor]MDW6016777.1 DUF4376 domain-containing protein [Vibrio plantisponsor]NNM39852.1 DUF4376 domain-containing protein [Vibrio plantisponsor]
MLRHYFSDVSGAFRASIKNRPNNEGFSTTQALPDIELAENEYLAMLDENGKVNMWPDKEENGCTWQVKTYFEKVTAYSKETKEPKQFDDKTLVTDDYTLTQPQHQYVTWSAELADWQNDIEKRRIAKNAEIKIWRDSQENASDLVITVDGIDWNADPAARDRIRNALASTFVAPFWTDANNVDQANYDLQKILDAYVQRGAEIHQRKREMNEAVNALTTYEEIDSFVVGWAE